MEHMLTVTQLARSCGLSRTTVLYYESIGLLKRPSRSIGNYRMYGEREAARLRQICVYRNAGVPLTAIRSILDRSAGEAEAVLKRRLVELDGEIQRLREHQGAILRLLRATNSLSGETMITKDKWVSIMKGAGFTEADMRRWHEQFEKAAPEEHQEFLEFLHISAGEIGQIRAWSRGGGGGEAAQKA
jgi:DNA-binding transcriptional MerR regulator